MSVNEKHPKFSLIISNLKQIHFCRSILSKCDIKSHYILWSLLNRVPCVPAWSTCQRAKNVPTSHFNVPNSLWSLLSRVPCVPAWFTCPRAKACHLLIFTCQRASNVPTAKVVPIFQHRLSKDVQRMVHRMMFRHLAVKSLKPLMSFSMEHVRYWTIIRLV